MKVGGGVRPRRDVSQVEDMKFMFFKATAFNGDISCWHGGGLLAEATALRDTEGLQRLTVCVGNCAGAIARRLA